MATVFALSAVTLAASSAGSVQPERDAVESVATRQTARQDVAMTDARSAMRSARSAATAFADARDAERAAWELASLAADGGSVQTRRARRLLTRLESSAVHAHAARLVALLASPADSAADRRSAAARL
ncbi:MAG: hypothetical protein AAFR76_08390, partial [Planctomycetota bacterium]